MGLTVRTRHESARCYILYVYMYVYICVYTYYISISISIYLYIYIYIYIYIYVYVYFRPGRAPLDRYLIWNGPYGQDAPRKCQVLYITYIHIYLIYISMYICICMYIWVYTYIRPGRAPLDRYLIWNGPYGQDAPRKCQVLYITYIHIYLIYISMYICVCMYICVYTYIRPGRAPLDRYLIWNGPCGQDAPRKCQVLYITYIHIYLIYISMYICIYRYMLGRAARRWIVT